MATRTSSRADSKRMYSWWWDSHISPKNSKWLQENLTDMDVKVKQMIKLLEEDADSFARRAEMYYKKRPELMKLVEEFYRAYRALAERYDNATGVLRQAHRTMAEAFPNQVPFVLSDESPAGSANEADPRTPEMPPPICALFDPDELQKDALGLSPQLHSGRRNGPFTEESNLVTGRRGLKQFNDIFEPKFGEGRVRKGLNFQDVEENERNVGSNLKVSATEAEILALKQALAKLEAEKEAGLLQYQQSLDKLSNLESEFSRAQEDSTKLNERASKAEAEAQNLRESLRKLEAEQEASLLKYEQCLDKVSLLENDVFNIQRNAEELTERASKAENEAESLKKGLSEVEAEKEAACAQYNECLGTISNLEEKLLHAEEGSRRYNELAAKAESELIILKEAVAKLTEEKEAAALQFLQCLEKISSLEHIISCAEEEAERLHREIDDGVSKLKSAEEKCLLLETSNLALQSELESLVLKMGSQSQELTENQKELASLWTSIQDEHLRFVEAETAFQTLQDLHSQTKEELQSLAAELQNRTQILKNLEIQNQGLILEVQEIKKENRNLDEVNMSSALSIKNLQDEVSSLREKIRELEADVELRTNERNALQQEIYCLKEELNELNKKNGAILEHVESTGYNLECFATSVKELQDENSTLSSEKVALTSQLQITTQNLENLSEKNILLENSLSDAAVELEEFRVKLKGVEDSCLLLDEQKSGLITERESLLYQLDTSHNTLEDLDKRYRESTEKHLALVKERESAFCEIEKLKASLDAEKFALTSKLQITTQNMENLSENNILLENSLSDATVELEELRVKLKGVEDSCLLLDEQKSGLITERESLLYQLDTSHNTLEDLDKRYRESTEKHLALAKERESAFCEIEKLKASLDAEKQAYSSFTETSEKRLAAMELQMSLLQEECDHWKKEHEGETDKAVNSQLDIFILQNCMQDMKENIFSLHSESRKLLEASEISKEVISGLEHENMKRQVQVKSSIENNKILRSGLHRVLRTLDINASGLSQGFDHETEQDQTLLGHIFVKVQKKQNSVNEIFDEYYRLVIEKSIIEKFLEQLRNESANILMERDAVGQELRIQSEQILVLQSRMEKLLELNEKMRLKVMEGNHKEQALKEEIENVCKNLHKAEEAYQILHVENSKALDENISLRNEIVDLGKQKFQLQDENSDMFSETISQNQLSLICKDIISEILEEMRKLTEYKEKLQFTNDDLEDRVKVMEGKLGCEQTMNLELTKFLEKSRSEAEIYLAEKNTLDEELRNQSEQYSTLQAKMEKLLELNEEMRLKVVEGSHKEEALMTEMENVCKKLQNSEEALQILHAESCKANEEKTSLSKEILELKKEIHDLEEVNINMFTETLFRSELSFIYKDVVSENLAEQRKLTECLNKLQFTNNDLEERVEKVEGKLGDEQTKNLELMNSLEKSLIQAENYLMERIMLDQELRNQSELNSTLQGKMEKLLELNDDMSLKLIESNHKEEALMTEMEYVCKKLQILEGAYQILHAENSKAVEGEKSLTKEILGLRKEKHELEEVNIDMFTETIFQSQLSFIYKDIVSENLQELRNLVECMDKLQSTNNDLGERVKLMEGKLGDEQTKNSKFVESLEKSKCEILQVETMLSLKENETSELNKMVERLSTKCNELEVINEEQNKLMDKVYSDKDCLAKKTEFLHEESRKMEMELKELQNEAEKNVIREESLTSELQMKNNEVQLWETQASTCFAELQISAIHQSIFEGKIHELTEACEYLQDRNNSKDEEIELLKDKISSSEGENGRMKTQLVAYVPAILTLKDSISSLEKHAFTKMQKVDTLQGKQPDDDEEVHHDGSVELQDLNRRIQAVEVAFEEFESQTAVAKLNASTKLERVMKEIEEVKSGNGRSRDGSRVTKDKSTLRGHEGFMGLHSKSEISEAGNEVLTKDILLDRISDHSSYGISRRETAGAGDRMLHLWESTDQDGSSDRMVGRANSSFTEYQRIESTRRRNSKHPSNESLVEKELSVDKLEISKRHSELPQEGNKRRILERLDSDAQKLANLQITVQDLKKKMEVTEKSKMEKGAAEYDIVKGQVEEAEEAITKLSEMNLKLTKNVQDSFPPADEASFTEENESIQSRRISEQARRGSEKIGRLQLELKKLQFVILKLDGERGGGESKGKSKVSERSPRVLLRDYLYGGMRTRQKQKKAPFCACMRPPTKGD